MSRIKFKHVFAALLVLSALSAFVIPERYTARAQPQVQSLFYPVARPARSVAAWVDARVAKPPARDARDAQTVLEENDSLRQELAAMSQSLEEMRRRLAEREKLGPVGEFCTPFNALGVDAGGREGLLLRGSTFDGLRPGQYVLFWGGVAGLIERPPGMAGAQVRLITDKGMRVGACFLYWQKDDSGKLRPSRRPTSAVLVEGAGGGVMHCPITTALTMEQVQNAGVQVGDWVVVEDTDWDRRLQSYRLGKVVHIAPQPAAPLYADIRIEPATSLMRLREVMVLTK
jgi:cell shape-determining protein MreC